METKREHDELTSELVPHRKLDDGDREEPKHVEATRGNPRSRGRVLRPVIPVG